MVDDQTAIDKSYISWKGELFRKGIHLTSLSIPVCFFLLSDSVVRICLVIAILLSLIFDLLRIFGNDQVKAFLSDLFGPILRPKEERRLSGSTTILLAALLVHLFYDLNIAAASMVIIVIGDTAAAIIGRRFGRFHFRGKTLEGSLAFCLFAGLAVLIIPDLAIKVAIAGVVFGAIIEALPIPIDDNITVPLAAGALMQLLINHNVII
jgi:dolichol kinase